MIGACGLMMESGSLFTGRTVSTADQCAVSSLHTLTGMTCTSVVWKMNSPRCEHIEKDAKDPDLAS